MSTDKNKPRILLITRNLPPLVGGMERLMQNLATGVAQYAELTVIGPSGCTQYLPDNIEVRETSEKLVPFLLLSTWLGIRACRKVKFDIVIGGSGLTAPALRLIAYLFGRKTLVYLHGLDLVVNNTVYQLTFVPCIRKIDQIVVNSENTKRIAIEKGVTKPGIVVINPGTNIPQIPDSDAIRQFRSRHQIPYKKILVFVGRMTQRKGLSGFIQNSLPAILASESSAGLLVVGKNPEDSLNKLGEEKEVLSLVSQLECSDRVIFLGQLNDQDLEMSYAIADVQIFPLIEVEGDVEGFGMVAIEAAALGTPTVAFNVGGVEDAVTPENGHLVPAGNYPSFTRAVIDTIENATPGADSCVKYAMGYSWASFNTKIRSVIADSISA